MYRKYNSFSFLDRHKIQALTFSLTRVWDHWCIQHCSNHPKNKLAAVINCCSGHTGKLLTKCKLAKCHVTEKKYWWVNYLKYNFCTFLQKICKGFLHSAVCKFPQLKQPPAWFAIMLSPALLDVLCLFTQGYLRECIIGCTEDGDSTLTWEKSHGIYCNATY